MADAKEYETVNTGPTAYNEKVEESTAKHDEFPEDTGRRQSVALNIVQNPLKVHTITTHPGQRLNHVLTVRSTDRTSRPSPTPESGLRLTACRSMRLSLARLP